MSKEKRRVPKLRFPGFTEDWEQRKLGDTNTFFTDGNYGNDYPTANEMSDSINGVPFLRGSNLDNGAINLMDVHYITKQKHNLLTSGHTKFDDIIIAVRGSLGNCGYVAKQFIDININSQLAIIRTDKNELSGLFLIEYLLSYLGKKEINRNITGTALKQLPINSLKMINIKYPSINEQEKISILLSKLNTSITLHQRKLEHLNLKKKALLQKLFPKNGERYPELRFPGFTDAWEQRKLSEVVTINPKTELPDEFKYVDLESVVGTNLLGFQVIKKENAPSRAQRLASYGDVFYQTVRPYQRNNYLFENIDKDMVFSTGYAQLRSKLDSYFLLTLVQNDNFVKVVIDNCTGTSYPAINGSELGKITVQIPSSEVEANQIGKVFRGIDKSITLHQRKLEHLQLQKKALLQQMFV